MKKRIFSLVLAVLMMLTFNIGASAETSVQPRYSYTSTAEAGLTIKSQQATCSADIEGILGITTRIKTKIILQKKTLLWWDDVTSWSDDVYDDNAYNSYHYGPLDSGTYRVRIECTVYSGSASETVTATSFQVKI